MRSTTTVAITLLLTLALPLPATSLILTAADDLWRTPPGSAGYDFASNPIPAGFFEPGSDPFDGQIDFEGVPLTTVPPGEAGGADTIVRRLSDTVDLPVGNADTIPIEIVALSLKSVAPITVTGSGGPSQWDVKVCLNGPQPQGNMTIDLQQAEGGTFDSTLPVIPTLIFTPVGGGTDVVLDCAGLLSPCSGLSLSNQPGPGHFVVKGPGGKDVAGLGIHDPQNPYQFETQCGAGLAAAVIGGNMHPGLESTGPGALDAICQVNNEAETALATNVGFHDAFLNDPNDTNTNGIPDFCEMLAMVPGPTNSWLGISLIVLLFLAAGAVAIRQLGGARPATG